MKTVKNESSITLFCAREVGVKAFETLVKLGVDIDKVVTKKSKDCKKIISLAKRLNIPVLADVNLNHYSVQKTISENGPGVAISVSYPNIVPKKSLEYTRDDHLISILLNYLRIEGAYLQCGQF